MRECLENVGVFPEESAGGDVEADDVLPAGNQLDGDEGASLPSGHDLVEAEHEIELVETGSELVELVVPGSMSL